MIDKKWLKLIFAAAFVIIAVCLSFLNESVEDFIHRRAVEAAVFYDDADTLNAKASTEPFVPSENAVLPPAELALTFSHNEYFYENTVLLILAAENDEITDIFYTLNGTSPDSEDGRLYTEEIQLVGSKEVRSYTVKACGKKSDGTYSTVQTHSYFIGENVFERFDTIVFSLSTDPDNLYDSLYGIAVPGQLRKDYIAESGDKNPDPPAPANYNMRGFEAERPVYIEVIDRDGQLILAQNGGMRVHGGWSRAMNQKTFRLYARRMYDEEKNSFAYDFFPDDFTYYGRPITNYDRLVLRNNANDNPFAFLRDESVSDMAAGILPDTHSNRAAAVFLNGAYYGFVWIHQYYDSDYLNDHNEIKNGKWAILGGSSRRKEADPEDPFAMMAAAEYQAIYDTYRDVDDDDVFAELCEAIDIDNFLAYYAVQVYVNNWDWPWGNYKVYRYYGEEDTQIHDGISTADGKWRWLLYDTDWTLGLYDSHPADESLGRILGIVSSDRGYSPLLLALLNRDDVRASFVAIMCDLMNHHFSPETIKTTVWRKEAERKNELSYNFKNGGFQLKNTWSSLNFVSDQVDKIIDFGYQRPREMRKQLEKFLYVEPSGYTIICSPNEVADIKVGTCEINKMFKGFYYDINRVEVTASKPDGYVFSHWLVNGEVVTDEILVVGKNDAVNDYIAIELVLIADESGIPVVTVIDHEGSRDFIEIYNPYTYDIDLRRFYLSSDDENPYQQILADLVLGAGERVVLYGNNYRDYEALGGFKMNFNLRNGERLYMTALDGETVFSLVLPKIDNDYVLVRNERNGGYGGERRGEK